MTDTYDHTTFLHNMSGCLTQQCTHFIKLLKIPFHICKAYWVREDMTRQSAVGQNKQTPNLWTKVTVAQIKYTHIGCECTCFLFTASVVAQQWTEVLVWSHIFPYLRARCYPLHSIADRLDGLFGLNVICLCKLYCIHRLMCKGGFHIALPK